MTNPAPAIVPVATLGRYELLFRIAGGGTAEVYAARVRGEKPDELVALKRILPQHVDGASSDLFVSDARADTRIESPHVVRTLDHGRAGDGSLYLVLDLVVGINVARVVRKARRKKEPLPLGLSLEVLIQAARGLHHGHEARAASEHEVVHRDVSPHTILVGVDGRVRISDFGVARAVLSMSRGRNSRVKGKYRYCAPEQLGEEELDRRSDVFSLGAVAWELVTGRRLFRGDHPLQTIDLVRNMTIPDPREVRESVPEAVAEAIMGALRRDRDERTPTAGAFGEALREGAQAAGVELWDESAIGAHVEEAGSAWLEGVRENLGRLRAGMPPLARSPADSGSGTLSGISPRDPEADPARPSSIEPPAMEEARRSASSPRPAAEPEAPSQEEASAETSEPSDAPDPAPPTETKAAPGDTEASRTEMEAASAQTAPREEQRSASRAMQMALVLILLAAAAYGVFAVTRSAAPADSPPAATESGTSSP